MTAISCVLELEVDAGRVRENSAVEMWNPTPDSIEFLVHDLALCLLPLFCKKKYHLQSFYPFRHLKHQIRCILWLESYINYHNKYIVLCYNSMIRFRQSPGGNHEQTHQTIICFSFSVSFGSMKSCRLAINCFNIALSLIWLLFDQLTIIKFDW